MIADTIDRVMHYARVIDPRYVYRSAINGRFVSRGYAMMNPATTYRDRVK